MRDLKAREVKQMSLNHKAEELELWQAIIPYLGMSDCLTLLFSCRNGCGL